MGSMQSQRTVGVLSCLGDGHVIAYTGQPTLDGTRVSAAAALTPFGVVVDAVAGAAAPPPRGAPV